MDTASVIVVSNCHHVKTIFESLSHILGLENVDRDLSQFFESLSFFQNNLNYSSAVAVSCS